MEKYVINRFPICAAIHKMIAENIGFNENEAKSLGLGRAIFYAVAKKNGFKPKYVKKSNQKIENIRKEIEKDMINFGGLGIQIIKKGDEVRAYMSKEITPEDYDKSVIDKINMKIGKNAYNKLEKKIREILKKYRKDVLEFNAYNIYKKYRDELRKKEIYR